MSILNGGEFWGRYSPLRGVGGVNAPAGRRRHQSRSIRFPCLPSPDWSEYQRNQCNQRFKSLPFLRGCHCQSRSKKYPGLTPSAAAIFPIVSALGWLPSFNTRKIPAWLIPQISDSVATFISLSSSKACIRSGLNEYGFKFSLIFSIVSR